MALKDKNDTFAKCTYGWVFFNGFSNFTKIMKADYLKNQIVLKRF